MKGQYAFILEMLGFSFLNVIYGHPETFIVFHSFCNIIIFSFYPSLFLYFGSFFFADLSLTKKKAASSSKPQAFHSNRHSVLL